MSLLLTNIELYRAIAEDDYAEMHAVSESSRAPKPDGSGGYILKYDPEHRSFKCSMKVVVFTGMWLESLLHLYIVKMHGEAKFKEVNRHSSYEQKLELVGVNDPLILSKVKSFRETRNELVHEKAYFDSGTIKIAQTEADIAIEVMSTVSKLLPLQNG